MTDLNAGVFPERIHTFLQRKEIHSEQPLNTRKDQCGGYQCPVRSLGG
jgi:hypothetical protein